MRNFVITGAARSGTGYIARVLSGAGVPCGHEYLFNYSTDVVPQDGNMVLVSSDVPTRQPEGLLEGPTPIADASWAALPWVNMLKLLSFHQVRDPLDCVSSLMGIRFFMDRPDATTIESKALGEISVTKDTRIGYQNIVRKFMPQVFEYKHEVDRALAYWILWNKKAEQVSEFSYRVEELDVETLNRILQTAGTTVGIKNLERGLAASKEDERKPGRVSMPVDWYGFTEPHLVEQAKYMAEWYGYEL